MEFMFSVPSFVKFGEGVAKNIGEEVKGMGARKVLLVYDKGVKDAGIVDDIQASLKAAELEIMEYDGVLPNPPDTIVEKAAEDAKAFGTEAVVAVGGGSSMDCAKAINILLTNPSPINQYDGIGMVKVPTKPLIAVPTTAGTGSEITGFSIITDTTQLKKMVIGGPFVGATMALVDPMLTVGLPPSITASTGMDALTHAMEAYVSKGAMIPTDVNALKATALLYKNIVKATKNGQDVEARTNMLLGSLLAGIAFNSAVLGLVHSIAHPLSVHCGLPHGVANACGLPYVMEFNAEVVPEKIRDLGVAMGLDVADKSPREAAKATVQALKDLSEELDIPKLEKLGVKKEQFDRLSDDALKEISTIFNPREATKQDVLDILNKAY